MLIHCVFLNLDATTRPADCEEVLTVLGEFARGLDGVLRTDAGPNIDVEGKSPDFDAGIVIVFRDRAALDHYAEHPVHKKLGARLVSLCAGGAEGIMVFDLECPEA